MNKLDNLYAKRELLLEELGKVEKIISQEAVDMNDVASPKMGYFSLEQSISKIKQRYDLEDSKIDKDVFDKKDSMGEQEWFAYMAHAERKKSLNGYKRELECAQFKCEVLEQIDDGDDKLRKLKSRARLDLGLLPTLIKRMSYRVESSLYYYQVVSGQMTRMDYETWLFGNKKVPSGDDKDFARIVENYYKAHFENGDNIVRSSHK